jgi:hypothetical protein
MYQVSAGPSPGYYPVHPPADLQRYSQVSSGGGHGGDVPPYGNGVSPNQTQYPKIVQQGYGQQAGWNSPPETSRGSANESPPPPPPPQQQQQQQQQQQHQQMGQQQNTGYYSAQPGYV